MQPFASAKPRLKSMRAVLLIGLLVPAGFLSTGEALSRIAGRPQDAIKDGGSSRQVQVQVQVQVQMLSGSSICMQHGMGRMGNVYHYPVRCTRGRWVSPFQDGLTGHRRKWLGSMKPAASGGCPPCFALGINNIGT